MRRRKHAYCSLCQATLRRWQMEWCLDCRADFWRWQAPLLLPWRNAQKVAHIIVSKAIKAGTLRPAKEFNCVDCGIQASEYDHRDYLQPLKVVPTCHSCNVRRGPAMPHHDCGRHFTPQEWRDYYVDYLHRRARLKNAGLWPTIDSQRLTHVDRAD